MNRLLAFAVALVVSLALAAPALANNPESAETLDAPWTAGGPGSVSSSDGTSPPASMGYHLKPAELGVTHTWTFSTVAGAAGTKNLTYSYGGWHGSLENSTVFLKAFVKHGETKTTTPLAGARLGSNGSFSYSGDISLEVQAGDTYGFELGGSIDDYTYPEMQGSLTVGIQNGLPVNTAPPSISGTPNVEWGTVSAVNGEWQSFRGTVSYSYQWLLCNGSGGSCEQIWGATGSSFTPESWLVNRTLRVRVTAHNGAGEASAESGPTPIIPEASWVGGLPMGPGGEGTSYSFQGELMLALEAPNSLVAPWVQFCVQWRRSATEEWSQQCVEAAAGSESHADCINTGTETAYCTPLVEVTGLQPGTEYEDRSFVEDGGVQQFSPAIGTFETEGEGPPRHWAEPSFSGSWRAGETMEATSPGVWTGAQPLSYSYSWEHCTGEPRVCSPVEGATGSSFQVPTEYVSKSNEAAQALRLTVTATNSYGEASVTSEEHSVGAAPAAFTTTGPLLEGEAKEGQTLTIGHYAVAGDPTPSVSYEWQRCDTSGESCQTIGGAQEAGYVLTSEDAGHTIRAVVTADNNVYQNGAQVLETSTPSAVVVADPPPAACVPGSYSLSGQEPCEQASPGNYVEGTGATSQTACPAGTNNPASGSTGSSACLADSPGSYSEAGAGSAIPCDPGSYSAAGGAESCTTASPGYYVAATSSTQQIPCLPGTYSSAAGAATCQPTPPGAWSSKAAADYTACPAGTYQPSYSAASPAACLPDPAGTYTSEFAWEVNPCGPGSYAAGEGNAHCTAAQPGYFVENYEAAAQTPCEPGSYASSEASTECTKTPAGSYDSTEASTGPMPCPAGTYAEASGSTSCAITPANTYSTGGATKPTPCPAETEAASGAGSCTPVPSASEPPHEEPRHEESPHEEKPSREEPRHEEKPQHEETHQETPRHEEPVQKSSSSHEAPTDKTTAQGQGAGANGGAQSNGSKKPPVLSGLSMKQLCLTPAALEAALKTRSRPSTGLAVSFRLNQAARVIYTVSRLKSPAHLKGCPGAKSRSHNAGASTKLTSGSSAFGPGLGSLTLIHLLAAARSRALTPGAYELTLSATNAQGQRSAPASLSFWMLPGRSKRKH